MTKKILVWLLTIFFLATVSPAEPQQPKKIAKIAYHAPSTPAAAAHLVKAFRQGLRELGYVEGKTFVLASERSRGRERTSIHHRPWQPTSQRETPKFPLSKSSRLATSRPTTSFLSALA